MAGTFRLKGMLIPSQGRKSSQGGGMIGGGVVSSVGTPAESAATVINNINNVTNVVAGDYSKITRITITDLLALAPAEVGENDMFIVYASGSDADGWSGDDFTYDGNTYPAESFFQLINGEWTPITDEVDLSKTLKFDDIPDTVYMIESLFPQTSFPNIYGREKPGLNLARIGKYQVDEKGNYKPVFETTGAPGGGTSSNWLWTVSVPYARYYSQGGQTIYEGGALSATDYRQFKELAISGGSNVYFADYGVTTHADMKAAYNAGKFVILRRDTELFVLMSAATSTSQYIKERYSFAKTRDNQLYIISVNNEDVWTSSLAKLVTGSDIREDADGWSGASDAEVPSALLVSNTFSRLSSVARTGDYDDLLNKPAIPSAVTDVVKYTAQSLTDAQKIQARQNIGAGGTFIFDSTPTANSLNPVTSGGVKTELDGKSDVGHTHSGYADTNLSNLSASAITNVKTSGRRIATIGGVDVYETGIEDKTSLSTSSIASYVAFDYVSGVYETRSASLLWNWFRVNNNLPYFYDNHTQTPSARTQAGFYVGRDGVWWYDGMVTAIGWHKLIDDTQWQTSTSFVNKEDYVCSVSGTDGSQAKLTVADFVNSINKIGRWFRYSLTFDGNGNATGDIDENWRHTNNNTEVAIFVYGKTNSTYASVDSLYADFVKMEISASLFLTEQKKLIKDNIFSSIEVVTYTVSGVSVPAIKFAFNQNIVPKLWSTGAVPFTINIEAKRVGDVDAD